MVVSASFSPDGTRVVTAGTDRTAKVWDAATETTPLTLKGHTAAVLSASFSPDGTRIVTGGADKTAKVWDARTGTNPARAQGALGHGVERRRSAPTARRSSPEARTRRRRSGTRGPATTLLELKGDSAPVRSASFSPDGSRIVTGSEDGTAKVWDAQDRRTTLLELKGHTSS